VGLDDDSDCEHDWLLDEISIGRTGKGADTASTCTRCDAVQYEPGQAALRDTRPPL
jgi:hypothetical protein